MTKHRFYVVTQNSYWVHRDELTESYNKVCQVCSDEILGGISPVYDHFRKHPEIMALIIMSHPS